MARILTKSFFDRDTVAVARELLGKPLCRRLDSGKILRSRITETEAYDGFEDKASHAHRGATTRNVVMFGHAGRAYVYLCYGVHWLLNLTTREEGYPAAVLIRGIEATQGPGRLTKHLKVDGGLNRKVLNRVNGLWVESAEPVEDARIEVGPRVGIDYAGEEWSAMPWRFTARLDAESTEAEPA